MISISVITCTYNAAATLAPTLRSVLAQEYEAVEHIIIDGNSTDGTLSLVERYKRDSLASGAKHNVSLLSEPDNGLYYAMNKGIKLATGDYIIFLNAGDTFPDGRTLSDVAGCVNGKGRLPGVLFGDTDIVDAAGRFLRHRRLHPGATLSWKDFRMGMLVCHQAFYALAPIAKNNLYDTNYRYSADVDWCIRVMKASEREGRRIVNIRRVVVNYLALGMTTAHHKASLRERFLVMRRHYGLFSTVVCHVWFAVRAVFRR